MAVACSLSPSLILFIASLVLSPSSSNAPYPTFLFTFLTSMFSFGGTFNLSNAWSFKSYGFVSITSFVFGSMLTSCTCLLNTQTALSLLSMMKRPFDIGTVQKET